MNILKILLSRTFKKRRYVSRAYLYSLALFFLILGGVVGGHGLVSFVFADSQTSITKDTDTDFDQGAVSSTQVTGSGSGAYVELAGTTGPDGTQYRKTVTFDNRTSHIGVTSEALVNFPVLVALDSGDINYSNTQDDGRDIRFTDSDGTTEIPYEIEKWDEAGTSYVWVRVPQIDADSNSDYIYLYYGSGSAVDEQDPEGVWGSEHLMVYHFEEASGTSGSGSVSDSTTNTSGTPSAGITFEESGQIGDSADFSGGTGISLGTVGASLLEAETTVSFWLNMTNFSSPSRQNPFEQAYGGWGTMTIETNGRISWFFGNNGGNGNSYGSHQSSTSTVTNGSWINITAVRNPSGNSYSWYKNGSYLTGTTYNAAYPVIADRTFVIGDGYVRPINGRMDEYRVTNVAQSAAWIAATYKSETDDFATAGSEEIILPTSGTWTSPSDSNVIDLSWNGGWGDGATGSSTAFTATVANVTSDATITFDIRTAATAGALSGATYQTIGVVNSGTSFTADKDALDALGLDTGTDGRYVQIRATFAQTDGSNPQLDDMVLTYLADDSAPSANASSVTMNVTIGGASVSSNDWVSSTTPYFSWTAGSDGQAGLLGYCLYLGTDSNGNPATSKGLLGTSPVSTTGTTCQFIEDGTNIDFATVAYQGGTWLTSSTSSYYLNIKAIDTAGNIFSGSSAQFQFRFDNTVPGNPSFVSLPGDFVSSKAVTLTWPSSGGDAASDSHSGVAGLQYRINNDGTWYGDTHNGAEDSTDVLSNDGSYTTDPTYDYDDIDEGNNLLYIRTWDNAGNVSTSYTTAALKVNTTAPSAPQALEVSPSSSTSNSYAFTWDSPSTYTGQESNITYCYTVNTVPSATTCSFTSAGQTSLSAGAYATQPSENVLYLVAKDEAGNINYDVYSSVEFTYSGSAPGIPTNADVADISVKATESWKLTLSWEEPTDIGAGIDNYKVYRTTSSVSCSDSFDSFTELGSTSGTAYSDTGLIQQNYYYCVKACDSANSCSAASSTVTGYPDGKFTSAATLTADPVVSSITTKKATVSWSTDRTSDTKVAFGTSCDSYNDAEPGNSTQTTSHTIVLDNLDPGTEYCYTAKWTDEDGNTGSSSELTFSTLPAPVVTDPTISKIGISSASLTFTVSGANSAKVYYGPSTAFGGLTDVATSTSETTYTLNLAGLLDDTKYFYKINTFDAEGDEYEGNILSFTTLPSPRISNVRVQEVSRAVSPTVLVTWDTNTEVSSIITVYPEGNPAAARDVVNVARVAGEHKMVVEGLSTNTNYLLLVKGRDIVGNEAVSDSQRFTTATDTRPPQINDLTVEGSSNTTGDTSTVQLIVSWNTDEPSTSQVEFGEGSGTSYAQKTQKDSNLAFNHVVIISGLTPSKVYHLRAISTDSANNEGYSIDTVTIAPRATDDALNLVLSNLQEAFGFIQVAR